MLPTEATARNGLGMGRTDRRGQIRKGGVERVVGPKSERRRRVGEHVDVMF
jgi:hypothetical protein